MSTNLQVFLWITLGMNLVFFILFRRVRSPYLYALFVLPSSLAHEMLHYITAMVLLASPKSFSIFPRKGEDGILYLGSVTCEKLNSFNAPVVAMAPLLLIFCPYIAYEYLLLPEGHEIRNLLIMTLSFLISTSFIPSRTDFNVAMRFPLGTILWFAAVALFLF